MKKIVAMLTTVMLLAGTVFQSGVFAAFSDVDDTNTYRKAITTLTKLSVIDGYEENGTQLFKPNNPVTRAEFTKLIVFMLGYQNLAYSSCEFNDVSSDHWAKNYIQTAYNLGIIAGYGDGVFSPDSPVTYEQALKMVVCTLGYEQHALQLGEWPSGYIQEANALNLTRNISGTEYTAGAPRGVIAQMLYNALEIDMYENNGFSLENSGKTLLNDYLKVKELKGTLIGVGDFVTEECNRDLSEDEMVIMDSVGGEYSINYSSFTSSISDISKYLGNTITVYYKQLSSNDERMLVIIDDETTKNTIYDLDYDDIKSFSGNTLKYYETATKSKTVKLKDSDLTVRYNGKIVSVNDTVTLTNPNTKTEESFTRQEALEKWLNPDTDYSIYGTVTLTDNSNDGTIDMVQIYNYQTMVAYTTPTTADYRITDKLVTGNYLILDPEGLGYTYTIKRNGTEIPVTSIAANDVILYATSLDESVYTLLVSNQTVSGSISSINSDSTQMTINSVTYDIGSKCASYIRDKDGKELKSGASGTFYLDSFGTAVFGTLQQTSVAPYAYITNSFIEYGADDEVYVTVYSSTATGSAKSYLVKNKVKFNGTTIKNSEVPDRLKQTASYTNGDTQYVDKIYGAGKTPVLTGYSQPARVTIKDNVITEIITMTSDEVQAQNDDNEKVVKCKDIDQYTYSSNSFSQSGKTSFSVNSSTTVIYVPGNRTQKDKYAKKVPSSAFVSGDSYYLEAYDINSSKIAGLIILYGNDGSLTTVKKDTDFSVVASLPESVYDEEKDDTVLKFDVYTGSSSTSKSWTTFDDKEFSNVRVGDVIQFAYDSDQYIQGRVNAIRFADIAKVLDRSEGQLYNWDEEQTPSEDNNYQKYKFDYRFKKPGTDEDEMYVSSTLGTVPYSRACIYNVSQVLEDEKKLYVTKSGFTEDENNIYQLDDSDYEEITITSTTKILRMEEDRDEISRYASGTTTDMSINDLKDAKNYGIDCSKILVLSSKGTARMILVYN